MSCGATSQSVSSVRLPSGEKGTVMAANDVDVLLAQAQDPTATQEKLRELWDTTKSTRVRRAVASNPNADSKTMCMAARLYIREVITNPSFELLNLFNEDKFVKQVYEAYTDPAEFYRKTQLSNIKNVNGNRINIARALLVSPNLRSAKILQDICACMGSAEFKRELKEPEVKRNVLGVFKGSRGFFGPSCLMFLLNNDVIDLSEFEKALDQQQSGTSYYTSKGAYTKFVQSNMENYRLLFRFISVNRPGNIRDLVKNVKTDKSYRTDEQLGVYANLYRDFLLYDVAKRRQVQEHRKSRYGYYGYSGPSDEDYSHHISDLIWTTIRMRNMEGKDLDNTDFDAIYRDICAVGFDSDFGPYKCELKLGNAAGTITGRTKVCEKLMALKDDRAFEFFVTSGMVWDEWYGKGDANNLESKLVERLNRINKGRFDRNEPVLYPRSDLDYFPTITVTQRNGLDQDRDKYRFNRREDNEVLPLPVESGRIGMEEIVVMAVKAANA